MSEPRSLGKPSSSWLCSELSRGVPWAAGCVPWAAVCAVGCRVCHGLLQSVVPLEAKRELGTVQRKGGRTVCVPWVGRNRSAALLPKRGF